ncbi:MAG: response regulator [Thaumarchaeota archaeon]|nr:response regulator [Nitrososphaerota archaeon]
MPKIKIMIINDSRAMRLFLEDMIKSYADCEIIGSYFDGNIALDSLKFKKPDVIILDLEMPRMDGLTFLERLLDNEKFSTIIVSIYAKDSSELVNDAMVLGAVDSLIPPSSNAKEEFEKFRNILHHKITKASLASNKFSLRCS